jgi:hypothetical protein
MEEAPAARGLHCRSRGRNDKSQFTDCKAVTRTAMTREQPAAVRGIRCTAGLVSLPPRHQHPQLLK